MSLTRFSPFQFGVKNNEGSTDNGLFQFGKPYRVFVRVFLLSLSIGLLAVAPKTMVASAADAAVSVITSISTEASTDAERVVVQATEQLQYTAFKLQEPLRLVIDISKASLGDVTQPIPIHGEVVERIEPIVFADENIVRLMFYLRRGVAHRIENQGQQLRVTWQGAEESLPTGKQQAAATTKQSETIVKDVTFMSLADRSVLAMQIAGIAPQVRVRQRREPLRLIVDIKGASLSSEWEKTALLFDPSGIVSDLHAKQVEVGSGSDVKLEVYLRSLVPFEVQQDEQLVQLVLTKPAGMADTSDASVADASVADASRSADQPVHKEMSKALPLVAQMMPAGKTPVAAPMSGSKLPQSDAAQSAASMSTDTVMAEKTKQYAGQKISLDFQNADINDILRLIAEVSGLNVIAGGDVQGTVTTRMVDVPWDQALDVILKINGLSQERDGNIIRVAPLKRFIAERRERMEAQQTESQAVPTVTQVVPVNYANANELKTNLERLLSDRGSIFIDERTNTLIITDTQENLADALALLETLDRQTPQVVIEARIVTTTRSFLRDLGVQLGFSYAGVTDSKFPNRVGVTGSASDGNFLVDLPAAVASGSGGAITFALAGASSLLNIRLSALESSGQGKVISSPKIATLDNTEATIQSGRRIPYATVSAEGTQTEFVDASVLLKVTPHVTPDGFVSMKLIATNNEADFSQTAANGAPTIETREATTEMLVKDGDTVVIGGLYKRTMQESSDGVPGLQDVPVLGWLFNKKSRVDNNEELLIFITPRIVRHPKQPTKAAVY